MSPLADIYVSYQDKDGLSNIWVGDVHIDDVTESSARVVPALEPPYYPRASPSSMLSADADCRRCVALNYVWGVENARSPSLLAATRATIKSDRGDEQYLFLSTDCAHSSIRRWHGFWNPGCQQFEKRGVVQENANILDLRIRNVVREAEVDPLTVWETCGWTYQEAVLSRRRLYFTNTRAVFECKRSMCHEDQFNGITLPKSSSIDLARPILPTSSWSSIMGLSDDQIHYQATGFYGTLVPWHDITSTVPPPSGSIEVFNISPDSNNPDDDWQIYMAIACREGCVEEHIPSLLFSPTTHDFGGVRAMFDMRWRDSSSFCKEAIPSTTKASELPLPTVTHVTKVRPGGIIARKCQAAFLHMSPRPSNSFNINEDGERIGEIVQGYSKTQKRTGSGCFAWP
ncbi:hypothetical protein PAAG_00814 [Paracoccidioides lutzii Pb01]|uniref:Heterokaryon incompatibility domain-containing protein n=1 Tax=Paracoccidioides lutzii (strain ATCC MYA-826 / Pb01) TaxID=502779 RepID=C1GQL9_PARBA|nr:hypothetical protein PAAG_00814 [Paracoccidioides lutzii Pb01]EEH37893.2 hypothetical protein PAAG_00814 [Paracoccidioides lutzii Pb01]